MKKILKLFVCLLVLNACEQIDTRTKAANIIYKQCVQSGENGRWCSCLRAELIDAKKQFTTEVADLVLKGLWERSYVNIAITGARLRCSCRIHPQIPAKYGIICPPQKPLRY